MSNSVDPDETAHMSRLIWVYAVSKILLLSPVAVKGLIILTLHTKLLPLETVGILISRLLTNHLIRIYTVYYSGFDGHPTLYATCLNSAIEKSTSEIE